MVLYKCEDCFYETKDKNKFMRHKNRKFPCKDRYLLLGENNENAEKSQNVPKVFHGVPNEQKKVLPICKWCNKVFSRQPNLNKHLKYGHCMIKRQWLIAMDAEYQRLLKEMKENKSKINEAEDGIQENNEIEESTENNLVEEIK